MHFLALALEDHLPVRASRACQEAERGRGRGRAAAKAARREEKDGARRRQKAGAVRVRGGRQRQICYFPKSVGPFPALRRQSIPSSRARRMAKERQGDVRGEVLFRRHTPSPLSGGQEARSIVGDNGPAARVREQA